MKNTLPPHWLCRLVSPGRKGEPRDGLIQWGCPPVPYVGLCPGPNPSPDNQPPPHAPLCLSFPCHQVGHTCHNYIKSCAYHQQQPQPSKSSSLPQTSGFQRTDPLTQLCLPQRNSQITSLHGQVQGPTVRRTAFLQNLFLDHSLSFSAMFSFMFSPTYVFALFMFMSSSLIL